MIAKYFPVALHNLLLLKMSVSTLGKTVEYTRKMNLSMIQKVMEK